MSGIRNDVNQGAGRKQAPGAQASDGPASPAETENSTLRGDDKVELRGRRAGEQTGTAQDLGRRARSRKGGVAPDDGSSNAPSSPAAASTSSNAASAGPGGPKGPGPSSQPARNAFSQPAGNAFSQAFGNPFGTPTQAAPAPGPGGGGPMGPGGPGGPGGGGPMGPGGPGGGGPAPNPGNFPGQPTPSQGPIPPPGGAPLSQAAQAAQANYNDQQTAQNIYMQMCADRQRAMMTIWKMFQDLSTAIFQMMQEAMIYRQQVMDKVAQKWSQVLTGSS